MCTRAVQAARSARSVPAPPVRLVQFNGTTFEVQPRPQIQIELKLVEYSVNIL